MKARIFITILATLFIISFAFNLQQKRRAESQRTYIQYQDSVIHKLIDLVDELKQAKTDTFVFNIPYSDTGWIKVIPRGNIDTLGNCYIEHNRGNDI